MTLKVAVEKLDDVPEAYRPLYSQAGDKFVLGEIEGLVPNSKLKEFRDNNIALTKELQDTKTLFDGIDPEQARALLAQQKKIADKELIDAGKIEELFTQRTSEMVRQHQAALQDRDTQVQGLTRNLEGLLIDGAIREAAIKSGVRAAAVDDVLYRGRATFKVVDGKAVPMAGDSVMYGRGGEPMGVDEWMTKLSDTAPHLFEPSRGGGAAGGNPSGGGKGKVVQAGDNASFLANLKDIASGKVRVATP